MHIDVNMGKDMGMQRLVLYEGDKPAEVAKAFGEKYHLGESKQSKLERLLSIKMNEYSQKSTRQI